MQHDSQQVMAMRYAFITNRALRALSTARRGRVVSPRESEALLLAADFLLEMRRGVAFSAEAPVSLGFSAESVPAATRAFSVISQLSLASQLSQVQELLENFEQTLRILAQGRPLPASALRAKLEQFMRALSQELTNEVSEATLGQTLESAQHVRT